jgi:hypothetical protein
MANAGISKRVADQGPKTQNMDTVQVTTPKASKIAISTSHSTSQSDSGGQASESELIAEEVAPNPDPIYCKLPSRGPRPVPRMRQAWHLGAQGIDRGARG